MISISPYATVLLLSRFQSFDPSFRFCSSVGCVLPFPNVVPRSARCVFRAAGFGYLVPDRICIAKNPYNQEAAIATYKRLIHSMAHANQYLLLYVLDLLSVFARKSNKNLM